MTVWAVIPVKVSADGKSRLARELDAPTRAALVEAMASRVIEAAAKAANIGHVALLGGLGSPPAGDVEVLPDPGNGLNAAVQGALAELSRRGASRAVFIHADLPTVSSRDLELLAAAPAGEIAIASDRHGTGTNALSLPLPEGRGFSFAFGPDSFARHHAEAERLGLRVEEIRSQGLARDVDEPDDLADAQDLLDQARR